MSTDEKRPAPDPREEIICTRVKKAGRSWLDETAAGLGISRAELLRRILARAQKEKWT